MSNRCRSRCIGLFAVGLLWLGLIVFQTKPGLAEPVIVPPGCPAAVAGYPYFIPYIGSSDPEMIFPTAEGYQGGATDTYYLSGFLKTRSSDQPRFGYMTIFARNRDIFDRLSADLHVFALFDLEAPSYYGTTSHFDLPPTTRPTIRCSRSRPAASASATGSATPSAACSPGRPRASSVLSPTPSPSAVPTTLAIAWR